MSADRRRLAALVGSNAVVRRSSSGRLLTTLTKDQVMAQMPTGARAVLLGTMSGDETHVTSRWAIPGVGRRELIVERNKLAEIIEKDHLEQTEQPFDALEQPEPAKQGSLFG